MRGPATATAVLTRLPVPGGAPLPGDLSRAVPWFPVVGAAVGGVVGGVYLLLDRVLAPFPAAVLAVAAGIALTGAFHEDGLADTCDGLGGRTRADRLAAMADPRVGTFGVLALVVSVLARSGALASLSAGEALPLIVAAHAAARGVVSGAVSLAPAARSDGLAAGLLAETGPWHGLVGFAVGGVAAFGLLGAAAGPLLLAAAGAGSLAVAMSVRRLGGVTGDVLGAGEQAAEIGALLAGAAIMG